MIFRLPRRLNLRARQYGRALSPFLQSKEVKTYTELGFTLITLILFSWFAIRPTILTIITLRKEHATFMAAVDSFVQKKDVLLVAQNLLAQHASTRTLMDDVIPVDPRIGLTVRALEGITIRHQVTIESLRVDRAVYDQPTDGAWKRELAELLYQLTIVGNRPNLFAFAEDLHRAQRLFLIESLTIEEGTMQVTISAPYLKLVAPSAAIGQGGEQPVTDEQILEQ